MTATLDLPVWLILLALAVGIGLWFAWRWEAGRLGRRSRARNRVAAAGERAAERLLTRAGYEITHRQHTAWWTMEVDGEPVDVSCRADLLVARDGEVFVAEVKTGDHAPDPTWPATRRQLLEYLHAFDIDGVLLIDIPAGEIREVRFPG